ncbi:hypothetical protein OG897_13680 [Streptomyces sp. NBC_00237]|uniref:hypothetical protein n=1 Tax=Streptomyces sp. NBC_00237 TaxID=2975687 RepID=UPI002254C2E3|nr:hypothetical protein [Streptomyces sp. NBC_00237]MCX5202494.1 hypothetical protein [Streptomyces sp. NBC_00237]
MTWRQVRVLIQHLPPESSTMTALRNALEPAEYEEQARNGKPEEGRWSMAEQLLAGISDSLQQLEYILILANSSGKGRKPKRPIPMRRPGVSAPREREQLTEQGSEFLFTLINGGAA